MKETFEKWMLEVDINLERMVGVEAADLPDYSYWDSWNSGWTPKETAIEAIEWAWDYW